MLDTLDKTLDWNVVCWASLCGWKQGEDVLHIWKSSLNIMDTNTIQFENISKEFSLSKALSILYIVQASWFILSSIFWKKL